MMVKTSGGSQQLKEVLDIAAGMLALRPRDRPYMWEIQMDLYETLKPYDKSIPNLRRNLCVPPPIKEGEIKIYSHGRSYYLPSEIEERAETPLHRAAKSNNRSRTIRLWELGWSLSQPDWGGETPRDIIKRSDPLDLRELENMVTSMLEAARTGSVEEIESLISRGLSPLMIDADGRSALYEATISFQINVVEYLLNGKARKHLMLWDKTTKELPLHAAAKIGFVKALERMLEIFPDINIYRYGSGTALYYAAGGCHTDAVRLLLKNKAKVLPSKPQLVRAVGTPVHAALNRLEDTKTCEIVKLLLEADDSHECLEYRDIWGLTPLLLAARNGSVKCFGILLQHRASVHVASSYGEGSLLHIIAKTGSHSILEQCIESFSLEELESSSSGATPLKTAQEAGHKEVARLLSSHIRQVRRSAGNKSGLLVSLRNGLESWKRP